MKTAKMKMVRNMKGEDVEFDDDFDEDEFMKKFAEENPKTDK